MSFIPRTNVAEWTHEELGKSYIQLAEAEAAFRIHKLSRIHSTDIPPPLADGTDSRGRTIEHLGFH